MSSNEPSQDRPPWNLVVDELVPLVPAGRSPRVLAVADEWFPARGGLSALNRYMCGALAAAGAETYCLVPAATPAERDDAACSGVRLLEAEILPGMTEREALLRRPPLPDGVTPDLVIGHSRVTGHLAKALVADRFPAARRIHFVHMSPGDIEWYKLDREDDAGQVAEERARLEFGLASGADGIVPVGPVLDRWLRRDLPEADQARLIRFDPGFDPGIDRGGEERRPPAGRPLILVMGRMEDRHVKGLDIAAEAVGRALRLSPPGTEWELVVRGAPAGSSAAVRDAVLGWIGHPGADVTVRPYSAEITALRDDLRRASLLLMPSRAEGYGLVGHEAIVAGTPALVSDRSGLGLLLKEVLRDDARHSVIPVARDASDPDVWGHHIAAALRDRDAAFRRAAALGAAMAKERTWALAAARVLAAG